MTHGLHKKNHARRGFTLVELLLALLISTMILGAAAAVFTSVMRGWERGNNAYRVLRAARTVSELIETNLRAAVPPALRGQLMMIGEDLSDGTTGGHRLTMITAAPTRLAGGGPLADTSVIEFRFDPAAREPMKMRVNPGSDNIYDLNGYEVDLSGLVSSFQVRYFDGRAWLTNWLTPGLPVAVEFHLTIADPNDAVPAGVEDEAKAAGGGGAAEGWGGQSGGGAADDSSSDEFVVLGPPGHHVSRLVSIPMGNTSITPRNVITPEGGEM